MNIQTEDGPEEERLHRELIVVLGDRDCEFTVRQGQLSFDGFFERKLATEDPGDIFAGSDFAGAVWLSKGSELLIASGKRPVRFKLPGTFNPSCTTKLGSLGLALPVAAVDCGKTPDPIHDTSTVPTHTDDCAEFKKKNPWVDVVLEKLRNNEFGDLLSRLKVGQIAIPRHQYYEYLSKPGTVVPNALFVGWAPNPSGGPAIRIVGFANVRIVNVYPSYSMDVEFLTRLCAFDEAGNVVFVDPRDCVEGMGRKGKVLPVSPIRGPGKKDDEQERIA